MDLLSELFDLSPGSQTVVGASFAANVAAVLGLAVKLLFGRRPAERVRVNVDAPTGEAVSVRVGGDAPPPLMCSSSLPAGYPTLTVSE